MKKRKIFNWKKGKKSMKFAMLFLLALLITIIPISILLFTIEWLWQFGMLGYFASTVLMLGVLFIMLSLD